MGAPPFQGAVPAPDPPPGHDDVVNAPPVPLPPAPPPPPPLDSERTPSDDEQGTGTPE